MAKNRIRRKPMAEINMVPFIDIMMVLLVAFMITTPMLNQGVKVELPKTVNSSLSSKDQDDPIVISINAANEYFVNLGAKPDEPKQLATVVEVTKKVIASQPSTPVLIQGSSTVNYGEVVKLMAGLQQSGVPQVGLITAPQETGGKQ